MPHKVHVIEADLTGSLPQALTQRDKLGREIAALAKQVNQPVFFHDYKGPVGGAPTILLECSETFMALVRTLPSYKKDHPAFDRLDTERAPRIMAYFSTPAAPKPAAPKAPRP